MQGLKTSTRVLFLWTILAGLGLFFAVTSMISAAALSCTGFPMSVATESELNNAITCYNAEAAGSYTINITADITLSANTTAINNPNNANLAINGNSSTLDGSSLARPLNIEDSNVTISDLTVQNGVADSITCGGGTFECGGGVYIGSSAIVTLTQSAVLSSTAEFGGGLANEGNLTIQDSSVNGNSATSDGGGLWNNGIFATLENTLFDGNNATLNGGGIYNRSGKIISISDSTVKDNTANSTGGGLYNDGGIITMSLTTVENNTGEIQGGGIAGLDGELIIFQSTVRDNQSPSGDGGGIWSSQSTTRLEQSTVSANSASIAGGGIFNADGAELEIFNSTISGNSATIEGGGLFNDDATTTIASSTIAFNTVNIFSVGIVSAGGSVTLTNSIIANNASGNDCDAVSADATNIDIDGSCDNATQESLATLLLGPLQNNGGPTETHALLPGSVAINAAAADPFIFVDQRDVLRPQGGAPDVGAYEADTGAITIIKDVIYVADVDVDSDRDFIFSSVELGGFMLDDPAVDDADGVTNTVVFDDLLIGNYTVTESPNGNWDQSVVCLGDDNISYIAPGTGATIDLDAGENVICTFTNERVTYELTYTKVLTPGTPVPANDWEFTLASLLNLVPGDIDQDFGVVTTTAAAGGSNTLTVPLDAYKVGEVVPTGYDLVQIDCGDGGLSTSPPVNDQFTIIMDQDLTCTFTNESTQAEITLIKTVVNDNGGTAGVNDFGLTIGGTPVNSGDSVLVDAGVPVAINEAGLAGYDFVSITGDAECPAVLGGTITPDPGAQISCTITNDDQPASITIIKDTVPDDPQDFEFETTGGLSPIEFMLDDDADPTLSNTIVYNDVVSGTYVITEVAVLGYETFIDCVDPTGDTLTDLNGTATVKVGLGEDVTCTYTNEKQIPEISIDDVTIVEGTGGSTTMEFTVSRSNNFFDTSVTANTADGTAGSPSDYDPIINEVINFAASGDLSKTISVDIVTDAIVEADETFVVNLSNPVNATIIDNQGEGTIENDDKATLKLSGGTSRTETDSGQVNYVFNAILQDGVQGGFTIDIANLDLTATVADNDYEANSDTLIFVGNEGELHTFTLKVNGDEKVEADEKFAAQFTSDPDTPLKDDIMITTEVGRFDLDYHTATIFNDDIAILKLSGGTSVDEGDSGQTAYVFTATLQDAVQGGFNIDYANMDQTAKVSDNDYDAVNGTISFLGVASEQHQVTVYVNGDEKVEADEVFALAFTSDPQTPLADDIKISGAPGKLQKFHEATIFNDDVAVVSLSGPIEKTEGDSGTSNFTFVAKLNADVDGGFDLPFTTNDGSAKESDSDYVDNDGTLRFSGAKGEEETITVEVNGDTVGEAHETFTVALGNPIPDTAGVEITTADSPQTGTIINDDAGVMFLNAREGKVDEDAGTVTVEVELSNVYAVEVTVDYAVTAGTATADDFTPMSGTLSFNAGEVVKEIEIPIVDDNWAETSESILITLSNINGAEIGNPTSAEILILDNEPEPVVSLVSDSISASESADSATVPLMLNGPSQAPITVYLDTVDGSAKSGLDFESAGQTVTFGPGETEASATIEFLSDTVYERDETLTYRISDPINAAIGSTIEGSLTILEDDLAPTISVGNVGSSEPTEEGQRIMTFGVSLSAPAAIDISIQFETVDGTAEDGSDYLANAGTLIIPAGSTKGEIEIIILGDEVEEGDETFTLRLFSLSDGQLSGVSSTGTVTGTISDEGPVNTIFLPLIRR